MSEKRSSYGKHDAATALDLQNVHTTVHPEIVNGLEAEGETVIEREQTAAFQIQRLPGKIPAERRSPRVIDEQITFAVRAQDFLQTRSAEGGLG